MLRKLNTMQQKGDLGATLNMKKTSAGDIEDTHQKITRGCPFYSDFQSA